MTGKSSAFGGSAVRTEATGYGCVYFCNAVLRHRSDDIEGKRVAISGSGTVALYAAQKAIALGARVVSMSDSSGFVHCKDGLRREQLEALIELKKRQDGRVGMLANNWKDIEYVKDEKPWTVACDIAMPCATEDEIEAQDAQRLLGNGITMVCEGANMPTAPDALAKLRAAGITVAPGKAANAGGVAVSGMELSQNAMRLSWSRESVDEALRDIMKDIHRKCVKHGAIDGDVDYVRGANLAGFQKVASAVFAHGVT